MDWKECMYVSGAKPSHLGLAFNFTNFFVFVPQRVTKFWPEVFLALFYVKRPQIDPKKDVRKFWGKTKSFWVDFIFRCIDEKQQQNEWKWCGEGLGAKPIHLRLVSTSTSLQSESRKLLTQTFFNRTNVKQ